MRVAALCVHLALVLGLPVSIGLTIWLGVGVLIGLSIPALAFGLGLLFVVLALTAHAAYLLRDREGEYR